jgi:hypothetical protein
MSPNPQFLEVSHIENFDVIVRKSPILSAHVSSFAGTTCMRRDAGRV